MFLPSLAAGLSFGNSTHVTEYAAFQRPGSVMEAFCTAPAGCDSSMLFFTLGSTEQEYSAAATPQLVSVVDHVTIKLTWPFSGSSTDRSLNIYCRVRGQTDLPTSWTDQNAYTIFINNGPSLAKEPLNCSATVKWTSSTGGQATVTCDLTRSAHTGFYLAANYTVFAVAGASHETEEALLWSCVDSDPSSYAPLPLTFSFTRDSSTVIATDDIHFKVVLFEKFSGRTVIAFQTLHILNALILPVNTLAWLPFSNGTGFVVRLHTGIITRHCERQRKYVAVINVKAARGDEPEAGRGVTLLCDPCTSNGDCSARIGGLRPAENYSVTLQQLLFDNTTASLEALPPPRTLLQQQPVHELHVLTEEQAPQTGPEIHRFYQVLDCDPSVASCGLCRLQAAAARACQTVRIFWKGIPRRQANGQLRFYQVQVTRGPGTEMETLNFTAAARTAEVVRHSNQELKIAVAGATGKGLPQPDGWSTCVIPPDDAVTGALLPRATMLSRELAASSGPCNVSWFLEPPLGHASPTATLLYCSSRADKCRDYSFVTMRPRLTTSDGWLPLERFVWSSSQLGAGDDRLCRDGTLAVAVISSPQKESANDTTAMSRLLQVDCRFARHDDAASQALPKVTPTYSDYRSACIKWLPFSQSCGAAPGLVVSLNVSLWSSDRSLLLEQRVLDGDATSHCFTENIAEAETYRASLTWITDSGLPAPRLVGPVEVRLRTPGLTTAAKSGVVVGGVISGVLMVVGLVGCVRKARVYRKTWRGNLTIPKIRTAAAAASDCQGHSLLTSAPFLQQTISSVEANQKCSYPGFSLSPAAELQSNRLRKWSSKDSAFASQDGSLPTACNEQQVYGGMLLPTDCQQQESENSADIAGQVYTTFGGLTHADFVASPSGEFKCSQTANEMQNYWSPLNDDESTVAYLPNEASLLLLALASDSQERDSTGPSGQFSMPVGCTSSSMLSGKCNVAKAGQDSLAGEDFLTFRSFLDGTIDDALPNVQLSPTSGCGHHSSFIHGLDAPSVGLPTPINQQTSGRLRDTAASTGDNSSSSYAYAVEDKSSLPSDYIRASEGEPCTALPATGFRCSACSDETAPMPDYISISDALKHSDA